MDDSQSSNFSELYVSPYASPLAAFQSVAEVARLCRADRLWERGSREEGIHEIKLVLREEEEDIVIMENIDMTIGNTTGIDRRDNQTRMNNDAPGEEDHLISDTQNTTPDMTGPHSTVSPEPGSLTVVNPTDPDSSPLTPPRETDPSPSRLSAKAALEAHQSDRFSPLLHVLDLTDLDSVKRFILHLQKTTNAPLPCNDTRMRDYDPITPLERAEVKRCATLMKDNTLLTSLVQRFLETSDHGIDHRILVGAQWLNRNATRDVFEVGSKAWLWSFQRWKDVNDEKWENSERVERVYHMPELNLLDVKQMERKKAEQRANAEVVAEAERERRRPAWEKEKRKITIEDLRGAMGLAPKAKGKRKRADSDLEENSE